MPLVALVGRAREPGGGDRGNMPRSLAGFTSAFNLFRGSYGVKYATLELFDYHFHRLPCQFLDRSGDFFKHLLQAVHALVQATQPGDDPP